MGSPALFRFSLLAKAGGDLRRRFTIGAKAAAIVRFGRDLVPVLPASFCLTAGGPPVLGCGREASIALLVSVVFVSKRVSTEVKDDD